MFIGLAQQNGRLVSYLIETLGYNAKGLCSVDGLLHGRGTRATE